MIHCYKHKYILIHDQEHCPVCEEKEQFNEITENFCNQIDTLKLKIQELEAKNDVLDIALRKCVARPHITICESL